MIKILQNFGNFIDSYIFVCYNTKGKFNRGFANMEWCMDAGRL